MNSQNGFEDGMEDAFDAAGPTISSALITGAVHIKLPALTPKIATRFVTLVITETQKDGSTRRTESTWNLKGVSLEKPITLYSNDAHTQYSSNGTLYAPA